MKRNMQQIANSIAIDEQCNITAAELEELRQQAGAGDLNGALTTAFNYGFFNGRRAAEKNIFIEAPAMFESVEAQAVEIEPDPATIPGEAFTVAPLFYTGPIYATAAIYENMRQDPIFNAVIEETLKEYKSGQWGDIGPKVKEINNAAVEYGESEIIARYNLTARPIFIVTHHKPARTTIFYCDEY